MSGTAPSAGRPLSVLVVAYGAPDLLAQCLDSVGLLPTVVVDNSSSPAVRAVCDPRAVSYVDPGSNLGFAAGVNVGLRTLRGRGQRGDVLLLNPDALLTSADVAALHVALLQRPELAAVSPVLRDDAGPQRAAWPFPSPARMWREALRLAPPEPQPEGDWLVGAVLLLRAEALDEVGLFDERFFLYCEETDWQRRARAAGWTMALVRDVTAHHVGAGTSTDPGRREALFHAGQETYVRKWFGPRGWRSYRAAALVAAAARAGLPGPRGAAARSRLVLYARGPRRAAGLD